eukprot:TRINITY_DN1484_c0_g1_i4.p1 TRINITY_DN1484_c0_g1~~TRINITY_DN1484_c0_g1_i4.p1  ORF type:complete len:1275 (-),score=210.16 TRINITY_DN1484_c0_g1_i4:125-3949(-)
MALDPRFTKSQGPPKGGFKPTKSVDSNLRARAGSTPEKPIAYRSNPTLTTPHPHSARTPGPSKQAPELPQKPFVLKSTTGGSATVIARPSTASASTSSTAAPSTSYKTSAPSSSLSTTKSTATTTTTSYGAIKSSAPVTTASTPISIPSKPVKSGSTFKSPPSSFSKTTSVSVPAKFGGSNNKTVSTTSTVGASKVTTGTPTKPSYSSSAPAYSKSSFGSTTTASRPATTSAPSLPSRATKPSIEQSSASAPPPIPPHHNHYQNNHQNSNNHYQNNYQNSNNNHNQNNYHATTAHPPIQQTMHQAPRIGTKSSLKTVRMLKEYEVQASFTYLDRDELRELQALFLGITKGEPTLSPKRFMETFPVFRDEAILRSIFSAIDRSDNNLIDFHEFSYAIGIMARGSFKERLKLSYLIIDVDGDGVIERAEMIAFINQLLELLQYMGMDIRTFVNAADVVNNLFGNLTTDLVAEGSKKKKTTTTSGGNKSKPKERSAFDQLTGITGMIGTKLTNLTKTTVAMCSDTGKTAVDAISGGISMAEYQARAGLEADVFLCFSLLFFYFYRAILEPIEKKLGKYDYQKEVDGWLPKLRTTTAKKALSVFKDHSKVRCVVKQGFFFQYWPEDQRPRKAYSLSDASVRANEINPEEFSVKIADYRRDYRVEEKMRQRWIWTIRYNIKMWDTRTNRYFSFAPVRNNISAQWFVCGMDFYRDLQMNAFPSAKKRIFIADWFFTPELFLRRSKTPVQTDRLDVILQLKAQQGVQIYILVWQENTYAGFNLGTAHSIPYMEGLHPNIHFIVHPFIFPMLWSHHQKIVVIDDEVAYVGGIDLCFGRYEDGRYLLCDKDAELYPGRDYTNYAHSPDRYGPPFIDVLDRFTQPRMPWQDVHMKVNGEAARDVALNFIQRWNHAVVSTTWSNQASNMFNMVVGSKTAEPVYIIPADTPPKPSQGTCECQVLRSVTVWSAGIITEQSIYKAYLDCIARSQHYIYIENQYFISSTGPKGTLNKIARAIVERVGRAIRQGQPFRVIVVTPIIPGGSAQDGATRYMIKQTAKTIHNDPTHRGSIVQQLKAMFPNANPFDYVTFHGLRNWAVLPNGEVTTEQIYVHSKLLIVDDRIVIMGSANINDRSMRGTRDSEICIMTQDHNTVDSMMNGKSYKASKFAFDLRKRLWNVFLGLSESDSSTNDPVSMNTFRGIWQTTSQHNTDIYKRVFPSLPDNCASLEELIIKSAQKPQRESAIPLLQKLKGYLVNYPYEFLKNEDLSLRFSEKEIVVPKKIFL